MAAGAKWENITGNLFQVLHTPFLTSGIAGDNLTEAEARYLTSIQADWRYVIPDDLNNPTGPTHPMLYVGGEAGVYRSFDKGQSWSFFPDSGANSLLKSPREDGNLPVAHVTELNLVLGNVNPTTGRPDVSTGSNILLATTYGRGSFAIRLAPIVFPNSLKFDLTLPNPPGPPNGSDSGIIGDGITNVTDPVIDGLSEQTAFGNTVTIGLIDLTNPNNPVPIPLAAGTNQTDVFGKFAVQIAPGYFKTDGSTDGPKVIGVQATDGSGTKGNIALFKFTLDTAPPGKPGAPRLEAASDSGLSNSDNITNVVIGPIFDVLPAGPNIIAQNVELLRDGVMVATVQIPAGPVSGSVMLTDPGRVSDGQHVYTAEQVDIASNVGPQSNPLTVTFDTIAPNTPPATMLDPNDDTGVKGDGQTKVRQPHLIGTLVPETVDPVAQVQIISSNNTVLGTAFSAPNGAYSVQFASPLADGVYAVNIRAEDVAGNLSSLSPVFVLRINNKLPTAPTIFLFSGDDSGVKGDNITNVRRPHLVGTTDPGLNVDLIDTNGDVSGTPGAVLPGTAIADSNGNYVVQFASPLPDGVYHVQTQARDAADNKALSPILALTIDATPPTTAPTLGIDPNDDSGVKGDGITNVRAPHLVGVTEPGGVVQIIDSVGNVLNPTTTADSSGHYSTQLAINLNNGVISLRARATDVAGNVGPTSAPFNLTIITVAGDYDGDGKADLAVFRPTTAQWFILRSTFGGELVPLGAPGDVPLQGDFDGDGKTDLAVFRPSTATWYILRSQLGPETIQFGAPNLDIPIPADYDGDGRTDLAVYRPTTGQWLIIQSSAGAKVVQFGMPNVDRPEPGDYDGDGKADLAVFRPTTGQWFIIQSSSGGKLVQLGQPGDLAVPAAYDGGFKTEVAVFRPSTAQWLINGPGGTRTIQFGAPNLDIPVPEDYDGDGKVDLAVFRPTTAQWLIIGSSTGGRAVQFGAPNLDIPVPEPIDVRSARFGFQTRSAFGGGGTSSGGGSGGLRTSALDFGGLASGLAGSGSTALTRAAALFAPVVTLGPASNMPAAPTVTTVPPQPAASALGSLVSSATQQPPITVVLQPTQPPVNLPRHQSRARHHQHDTALAAALHSLGRIRVGHFPLPGHEA